MLTAFDIGPNGDLSNRRVGASTAPVIPDGICLDAEGAIWVANPVAPQCVRIAEGGQVLETIETGQPCFACMLGGDDGKSLFMLTADHSVTDATTARLGVYAFRGASDRRLRATLGIAGPGGPIAGAWMGAE